jgi:hypothetical protein
MKKIQVNSLENRSKSIQYLGAEPENKIKIG